MCFLRWTEQQGDPSWRLLGAVLYHSGARRTLQLDREHPYYATNVEWRTLLASPRPGAVQVVLIPQKIVAVPNSNLSTYKSEDKSRGDFQRRLGHIFF